MFMDRTFDFFEERIKEIFTGSFASVYDKIDEWTSIQRMNVVVVIDEHYDVLLEHEDLKVLSVQELHQKVLQKVES